MSVEDDDAYINEVPMRIDSVEFEGIERTDKKFLHNIFKPILRVSTLSEFKQVLAQTLHKLSRLNLFKGTSVNLNDSSGDALKLVFKAEEKKYRIKAGTEVQRNDVAFNFGGFWANIGGRGESLEASASYGMTTATPLFLSFKKPVNGDPDRIVDITFNNSLTNASHWQPFKLRSNTFYAAYSFPSLFGLHSVKASFDWRHIYDHSHPSGVISFRRKFLEHSVKSSVHHTITRDSRDSHILPTRGRYIKVSTELAGLFGNVSFLKHEMFCQQFIPVYKGISFGLSGKFGTLLSHLLEKSALMPMDKFHIGGPNSIRGFQINSLGPKDRKDFLGGSFMAEGGLQISFPLFAEKVVRGHLFTNFGVLSEDKIPERDDVHVSLGCGIMANMAGGARIELNACCPIRSTHSTQPPSLQVGVGIDFL